MQEKSCGVVALNPQSEIKTPKLRNGVMPMPAPWMATSYSLQT
jgi:hypothetical protein